MKFKFDEKRATQAACFLLNLSGCKENYMKLLSMLYIADREALKQNGTSITGSTFTITPLGIFGSEIYECIKGTLDCFWTKHIITEDYDVKMIKFPGLSELSRFDTNLLEVIFLSYKDYNAQQILFDTIRKLPEWCESLASSSAIISPENILIAAGVPEDIIDEFKDSNEYFSGVDDLFISFGNKDETI